MGLHGCRRSNNKTNSSNGGRIVGKSCYPKRQVGGATVATYVTLSLATSVAMACHRPCGLFRQCIKTENFCVTVVAIHPASLNPPLLDMPSNLRSYGASSRDSQAEPLISHNLESAMQESDSSSVHTSASTKSLSAPLRRFSASVRTNLTAIRRRTNSTSSVSSTVSTPSKLREISMPMTLGSHRPVEHIATSIHKVGAQRVSRLTVQSKSLVENRASWRDDNTIDPVTLEAIEIAELAATKRAKEGSAESEVQESATK